MKSNIIARVLAIGILATSVSAFALPDEKDADGSTLASDSQKVSRHKGKDSCAEKKAKKPKNVEDQQQYDPATLGIYG